MLLELGNNSANVVHSNADLGRAAQALAQRAFAFAAVCIVVQRIYVQQAVWEPFVEKLVTAGRRRRVGDPEDEATDVGPVINQAAAKRAESW